MDLGNFGGHEVFNSFGGQTNHQTFKATCRLLVLRKFVVIIVLINQELYRYSATLPSGRLATSELGTKVFFHQIFAFKRSDPIAPQSLK